MKLTLQEVLSGFVVLYDFAEYVNADYSNKGFVTLMWGDGTANSEHINFDHEQIVEADGDTFSAVDMTGERWRFVALKAVRLNEIPEIR